MLTKMFIGVITFNLAKFMKFVKMQRSSSKFADICMHDTIRVIRFPHTKLKQLEVRANARKNEYVWFSIFCKRILPKSNTKNKTKSKMMTTVVIAYNVLNDVKCLKKYISVKWPVPVDHKVKKLQKLFFSFLFFSSRT